MRAEVNSELADWLAMWSMATGVENHAGRTSSSQPFKRSLQAGRIHKNMAEEHDLLPLNELGEHVCLHPLCIICMHVVSLPRLHDA